jgi:hypothetical protein
MPTMKFAIKSRTSVNPNMPIILQAIAIIKVIIAVMIQAINVFL